MTDNDPRNPQRDEHLPAGDHTTDQHHVSDSTSRQSAEHAVPGERLTPGESTYQPTAESTYQPTAESTHQPGGQRPAPEKPAAWSPVAPHQADWTAQPGQTFYGDRPVYGGGTWWDGSNNARHTPYHPAGPATATMPSPAAVDTSSKPRRMRTTLLGTAIVAALVGGGVGAGTVALTGPDQASASSGITMTTATGKNTAAQSGTVSAAAETITPSVVTISVSGNQESGIGSGIVIRSDGYILTNNHVVSVAGNGGAITVQTSDGRTAKATLVGTDPTDDLAVIRVSGLSNLKAATFAKSSDVKVGQTVVAVGAPLGLSDTVTSGIVSATSRAVRSGDNDEAVFAAIQTDAAINPGNSGGALVDLNGNVIGVNAAIATTNTGGVQIPGQSTQSGNIGIGFAIPSDEAARVASELITTGKATHAVLGVSVSRQTQTSDTSAGATVAQVTSGGAAAKAGLQRGDVITAVDGARIEDGDSLIATVRAHAPGDSVSVTYTRNGQTKTATVTLSSASS